MTLGNSLLFQLELNKSLENGFIMSKETQMDLSTNLKQDWLQKAFYKCLDSIIMTPLLLWQWLSLSSCYWPMKCIKNGIFHQMDINNTFLHGRLNENLYLLPSQGLKVPQWHVCNLKKALYGLNRYQGNGVRNF